MRLLLATRNAHKAREFAVLLAPHEVAALPDAAALPPETGTTFAANALAKARAAATLLGTPAVADDSGIEAAALGGRPGVRSARYAGEHATDAENLAKLLREAPAHSALAYVCAIAFVDPAGGVEHVVQGTCTGTLADRPRGDGGFGYDPVFVPDDDPARRGGGEGDGAVARGDGAGDDPAPRTMAELTAAEKDAISHRGRAARALLAWLKER